MGEAKRRRQAAPAMDVERGEAIVRQSYLHTCRAISTYPASLVDALIITYLGRNASLDFMAEQNPKDVIACRSGCSACCHQMVLCSPFEIFIVAQHILTTRSDNQIHRMMERLAEISKLPMTPEARYGRHATCPLLEDNRCSIYDKRPSVCRALFSNSREKCEESLANGGGDVGFLIDPPMVSSAMQIGIDCALRIKQDMNTEPVEMCGSLLVALRDFDRALANWLGGGSPFSQFQVRRDGIPTNAQQVDVVASRLGF
jgi:Fe-S-cluster containining protein